MQTFLVQDSVKNIRETNKAAKLTEKGTFTNTWPSKLNMIKTTKLSILRQKAEDQINAKRAGIRVRTQSTVHIRYQSMINKSANQLLNVYGVISMMLRYQLMAHQIHPELESRQASKISPIGREAIYGG